MGRVTWACGSVDRQTHRAYCTRMWIGFLPLLFSGWTRYRTFTHDNGTTLHRTYSHLRTPAGSLHCTGRYFGLLHAAHTPHAARLIRTTPHLDTPHFHLAGWMPHACTSRIHTHADIFALPHHCILPQHTHHAWVTHHTAHTPHTTHTTHDTPINGFTLPFTHTLTLYTHAATTPHTHMDDITSHTPPYTHHAHTRSSMNEHGPHHTPTHNDTYGRMDNGTTGQIILYNGPLLR